mmetsp:Transcript_10531/g.42566  ORF Transcript_10531/g.42566 Transcript_10531/m.42566 type:complete len:294 (-) Transcript_10531:183-1064(-)
MEERHDERQRRGLSSSWVASPRTPDRDLASLGEVVVDAALDPVHGLVELLFVAALGDDVEEVVGRDEVLEAAREGVVGEVDGAVGGVLVEDRDARDLLPVARAVVVVRRVEVLVEVGLAGRVPREVPQEPRLVRLERRRRRARHSDEPNPGPGTSHALDGASNALNIARLEVRQHALEAVGHEAARRARLRPVLAKHEVVHDELRAAFEEVSEGHVLAVGGLEHVVLRDRAPRQLEPRARHAFALARERLLLLQELLARGDPLLLRDHAAFEELLVDHSFFFLRGRIKMQRRQ